MKNFILIILILSFGSCKNDSTKVPTTSKQEVKEQIKGTPIDLPSIPTDLIKNLYQNCTYTDYIFNDLDFSISQENINSIKASIGFISTEVQKINPADCKALGRKFFHVNGEIVLEADVYFSENCTYYLFYVDGKPTYANKMTKEGLEFYGNIIRAGQQQRNKILKEGAKAH